MLDRIKRGSIGGEARPRPALPQWEGAPGYERPEVRERAAQGQPAPQNEGFEVSWSTQTQVGASTPTS